ncbi:hypothetical protein [Asanoa siamensis]|uniref:Uncharacterized protein n=1 Tax=Asanoa siamensis TaxID=926357 RepID=A0ABQ4CWJ8_9ACTN|nr:hypothetical protein [Asanoa siamensis]GIF75650.1 hypothetical protein Asi02nite_51680 [Asanoa siamensis]
MTDATTAPARPRASRPPRSAINDRLQSAGDGPGGSTPLHVEVQQNLEHLWNTGGRRGATEAGRRPDWIYLRPAFIVQHPDDPRGPALARLVPTQGLALRMELLMLFDAQCRFAPGETVRLPRTIEAVEDERYQSWQKLVLSDSSSDYRQAADLRARQIKKALRVLDDPHGLVRVGREKRRPARRDYDHLQLRSEASTPVYGPRYTVPESGAGVRISRHFFTSLWAFALTNTEIAAFLALSFKRAQFPLTHLNTGIYAASTTRGSQFGLKENTWRSARQLHAFGLVDRQHDTNRDPTNGMISDFGGRWKRHEVMPTTFTIVDQALQNHAVPTIHRILREPTYTDQLRLVL